MSVLSREEFDSIEFDAAATGDHAAAARRMSELATTGAETASMPRAEAYVRAGEQWLLAGELAAAAVSFRQAMADGGPVFADPRVSLARALFQLGRDTEARELISRLKAEGPADPRACDLVAELLVECSDLVGALDWATTGVEICLRHAAEQPADDADGGRRPGPPSGGPHAPPSAGTSDDESELRLLLSLRYRIRNDLGLPEDSYDQLLDS